MTTSIVVVGAGGFGREALDVLEAINADAGALVFRIVGVVDSAPSARNLDRLAERGIAFLGSEAAWLESAPDAQYLIGVGSPQARMSIDARFRAAGLIAAAAVHPRAVIGSRTSVAEGSVICSGVQVSTNVSIGRHVHLNPNSTIGHDTGIEEFVSVNPGAVVSGDVLVRAGALVGAGAVVLQGLMLGAGCTVGAAACVVSDVPSGATVKGVPAR